MKNYITKLILAVAIRLEWRLMRLQGKGWGTATIGEEVAAVARFLPANPRLIIDIGGNVGDYARMLRARYGSAKLHVFEPSTVNQAILRGHFTTDHLTTLHCSAVSDIAGEAVLYSDRAGSGLASIVKRDLKHHGIRFSESEKVRTIRFEEFWRQDLKSENIDFVKLDIEGHELSALSGFGEALDAVAVIQFEFGGCNIDTRTSFRDFFDFFTSRRFTLYRITPVGLQAIERYSEADECYLTTNYLAVRRD